VTVTSWIGDGHVVMVRGDRGHAHDVIVIMMMVIMVAVVGPHS
jgi:hypothetical protein